jgi:hypothetical protein
VAEGQTIILGTERAAKEAVKVIVAAPTGSVLTVSPPRRTLPQNAKMHAMLSDISRAKPGGRVLSPQAWKCLFMDALAAETGNAAFCARWEPGLDGTGAVNLGYRSSRLVKVEMGELIDFIDCWGSQNGVVWSEPKKDEAA